MSSPRGKQAVRGGAKPQLPFWVWLIAGFAFGVGLTMFWILRDGLPTGPRADPNAKPAVEGEKPLVELAAGDSRGREGEQKAPKFSFYSVLPEMETVIPDAELSEQSQRPPEPPPANTRLFLQVGSFGNSGDAEALKARMALVGVQAQVVPVNINGRSWHRVRLGPYADARALESAKRELAASNYEAIALRETGQ